RFGESSGIPKLGRTTSKPCGAWVTFLPGQLRSRTKKNSGRADHEKPVSQDFFILLAGAGPVSGDGHLGDRGRTAAGALDLASGAGNSFSHCRAGLRTRRAGRSAPLPRGPSRESAFGGVFFPSARAGSFWSCRTPLGRISGAGRHTPAARALAALHSQSVSAICHYRQRRATLHAGCHVTSRALRSGGDSGAGDSYWSNFLRTCVLSTCALFDLSGCTGASGYATAGARRSFGADGQPGFP